MKRISCLQEAQIRRLIERHTVLGSNIGWCRLILQGSYCEGLSGVMHIICSIKSPSCIQEVQTIYDTGLLWLVVLGSNLGTFTLIRCGSYYVGLSGVMYMQYINISCIKEENRHIIYIIEAYGSKRSWVQIYEVQVNSVGLLLCRFIWSNVCVV